MKAKTHAPIPHWLTPVLFALALALTPLHAQTNSYLPDGKPDVIALLAPPPLPDSPEQAADMAEVQSVYHAATSNEIAGSGNSTLTEKHAKRRQGWRGERNLEGTRRADEERITLLCQ